MDYPERAETMVMRKLSAARVQIQYEGQTITMTTGQIQNLSDFVRPESPYVMAECRYISS